MDNFESLTNTERVRMRGSLQAFMLEHPAKASLSLRLLDWMEHEFAPAGAVFSAPLRIGGAALVFVLMVGIGTSYAASSALPGQPLYAVKVNVNEKIESALAMTPQSKAQLDATLTARRLEEAEILAAQDKLSPQLSSTLQASLGDAAENFDQHIATLAQSSDGAAIAADVQSDLEATLSAHANVLASISAAIPGSKDELTPIISTVSKRVASARLARSSVESTLIASSTQPSRAVATQSKEDAQIALGSVRTLAQEVASTSGASSSEPIAQTAVSVQEAVSEGEEQLNHGEYGRAFGAFQSAIRAASETKTETDIRMQLHRLVPMLSLEGSATTTDVATSTDTSQTPALNENAGIHVGE